MKKLFASVLIFPLKWHHAHTHNETDFGAWWCLGHKNDRKRNRKSILRHNVNS